MSSCIRQYWQAACISSESHIIGPLGIQVTAAHCHNTVGGNPASYRWSSWFGSPLGQRRFWLFLFVAFQNLSFQTMGLCYKIGHQHFPMKLFFFAAPRPNASHGLLILEVCRSHSDTQRLVGLLWTSDQLIAETWQRTTLRRDRHPCPRRDLNPQSLQARCSRPTP